MQAYNFVTHCAVLVHRAVLVLIFCCIQFLILIPVSTSYKVLPVLPISPNGDGPP